MPRDARVHDDGVLARQHPSGTTLIVDSTPLDHVVPGTIETIGRASPATLDVIVGHTHRGVSRVTWFGPRHRLPVFPSGGDAVGAPTTLDARRFVYLQVSSAGLGELWEATVVPSEQLRLRRICPLGRARLPCPAPVVVHMRRAVVVAIGDGERWSIEWISLADGRRRALAHLTACPRRLVGAVRGRRVGWIDDDGQVFWASDEHEPTPLGFTDDAILAMSPDGRRLGWTAGDDLITVELDAGARDARRLPKPLAWLGSV